MIAILREYRRLKGDSLAKEMSAATGLSFRNEDASYKYITVASVQAGRTISYTKTWIQTCDSSKVL